MRLSLTAALLLSSTMLAGAQDAQKEFPAKLVGHALLPANTMVAAPADDDTLGQDVAQPLDRAFGQRQHEG